MVSKGIWGKYLKLYFISKLSQNIMSRFGE